MPYTQVQMRDALDKFLSYQPNRQPGKVPLEPGEFNYVLTQLAVRQATDKPNYEKLRGVVGDMVCAMLEFWMREIQPYEVHKRLTNGDVGYIITEPCGCSHKSFPGVFITVNTCDGHNTDIQTLQIATGIAKPSDFVFTHPDAGTTSSIKHHSGCTNPYCVGCVDP